MTDDLRTLLWKEGKEMLRLHGSLRSTLMSLVVPMLMIGVLMPWQMGPLIIRWPLIGVALCIWMPLLFVSMVVPDAFAGERERRTLETLLASRLPDRAILFGKLLASVLYGTVSSGVVTLMGVVTVGLAHWRGESWLPLASFWLATLVVSLPVSLFAAGAGVLISLRAPTVRQATQLLSAAAMSPLLPFIVLPVLPRQWVQILFDTFRDTSPAWVVVMVMALLLAIDFLLLSAAARRFRRSELILD